MTMALLAGGGTIITAISVQRHEFCYARLSRLSLKAVPYYGARQSRRKFLVCRAAAAAAPAESDVTVKTALPTIPSEATLAKV